MKPSCLTSVSPLAQWGLCAQLSSLLCQHLHQASGIQNLLLLGFNAGRCTADLGAIGYRWGAVSHPALFPFGLVFMKQQVARILELAKEEQAAELRVLRDTSER